MLTALLLSSSGTTALILSSAVVAAAPRPAQGDRRGWEGLGAAFCTALSPIGTHLGAFHPIFTHCDPALLWDGAGLCSSQASHIDPTSIPYRSHIDPVSISHQPPIDPIWMV